MASSYNGASMSLVGALLALGANLNAVDQASRKASDWAREGHHSQIATFLDNIMVIPLLCSVYIPRLGKQSKLRLLPKDVFRLVREMLAIRTDSGVRKRTRRES